MSLQLLAESIGFPDVGVDFRTILAVELDRLLNVGEPDGIVPQRNGFGRPALVVSFDDELQFNTAADETDFAHRASVQEVGQGHGTVLRELAA